MHVRDGRVFLIGKEVDDFLGRHADQALARRCEDEFALQRLRIDVGTLWLVCTRRLAHTLQGVTQFFETIRFEQKTLGLGIERRQPVTPTSRPETIPRLAYPQNG